MFSLLTLKETHSIDSFQELADRPDVMTIVGSNYEAAVKWLNNSNWNRFSQNRKIFRWNKARREDHLMSSVYVDNLRNAETYLQTCNGLALRMANERLIFQLFARFAIIKSETTNKRWAKELKEW